MARHIYELLTKLTTGEVGMAVTAETASFDQSRASASAVLIESASLTFEQMYGVESYSFWCEPLSSSVNNYRVTAIDTSDAALQAAYVISASFLS